MFVPARKTMLGLVLVASLVFAVTPALADPSGGCVVGATTTCTFNYTGAPEAWVVPAGATSAVFDLFGGAGGNLAPSNPFGSPLPGGSGGKGGSRAGDGRADAGSDADHARRRQGHRRFRVAHPLHRHPDRRWGLQRWRHELGHL